MSDTPRTDAAKQYLLGTRGVMVEIDFARQLERELNEARRIANGYLENAVGSCPACAEGVCCGSVNSSVEHKDCVYAELNAEKERSAILQSQIDNHDATLEMAKSALRFQLNAEKAKTAKLREVMRFTVAHHNLDGEACIDIINVTLEETK